MPVAGFLDHTIKGVARNVLNQGEQFSDENQYEYQCSRI
jgi:hypothetical protein